MRIQKFVMLIQSRVFIKMHSYMRNEADTGHVQSLGSYRRIWDISVGSPFLLLLLLFGKERMSSTKQLYLGQKYWILLSHTA